MGVHFVRWVLTSTVEVAEDSADQERVKQLLTDVTWVVDPQPTPGAGVVALLPKQLKDTHLTAAVLYVPGAAAGGDTPAQQDLSPAGFALTHTTDVTDPHTADLTALDTLNDSIMGGTVAINVPLRTPYLRLSGAALAAWVPAPSSCQALVTYNDGKGRARAEFGGFVDDTVDTFPSVLNASRLLLDAFLRTPAGVFTVENQGRTQSIAQVAYASVAPTGEVWVRNSQIGSSGNQIPPSAADNTPERFAFHPAVFLRRQMFAAQLDLVDLLKPTEIGSQNPRDPFITVTEGVLAIWQVNRAPTHSRWLFILDGVPREVVLAHPAASDLRTPVEIWNGLILGMIQGSGATTVPIFGVTEFGALNIFQARGALSIGNFQRLEYARFLEPLDATVTGMVTMFTQTA